MKEIYLDNSATTAPCLAAINAMTEAMTEAYGNPSSLHSAGTRAAELLLNSRNEILCALHGSQIRQRLPRRPGMRGGEEFGSLIFTASGTEANNLAILGSVITSKVKAPEIITTDSEHPAVLATLDSLEDKGFKIHRLSTKNGAVCIHELTSLLCPNTVLVSIMLVNNETGAKYDVSAIFEAVKAYNQGIICHTDCVQAFQKVKFTPKSLLADMITVSAHKLHGPKGVGALWISEEMARKKRLSPIIFGGGQEGGLRSGTENIPGIAAFAAAVKDNGSDKAYAEFEEAVTKLRVLLLDNLPSEVKLNQPFGSYAPHILSLSLPLPKSQPILNYLSALGIYVSSGSACSSHKNTVSHVLKAFGLTDSIADGTIRVSLDKSNTEEEIICFCEALNDGIRKLGKK